MLPTICSPKPSVPDAAAQENMQEADPRQGRTDPAATVQGCRFSQLDQRFQASRNPQSVKAGSESSASSNQLRQKRTDTDRQNPSKFVKKRPPPPANCVPLWGSCKSAGNVCCDVCAFCQCRLFKTVCFCRMGNPRC
uniref:Agouti-signaling protein n=1 Tax=Cyprinodon variegatus TaxID=28743 RepID=A0A3Q2DYY4_CYPVA